MGVRVFDRNIDHLIDKQTDRLIDTRAHTHTHARHLKKKKTD